METTRSNNKKLFGFNPIALVMGAAGIGVLWTGIIGNAISLKAPDKPAGHNPRSVAYFVTNLREAKEVNSACHAAVETTAPDPLDCKNALEALNLAHVGQNYQN